ncbi:hypothetical protein FVE85_8486 [Porphyridium purpureum]|uniref:Ca3427-like PBP 2 domain-containing protein n=1 Tax=Porphyridium purpureum TaxID=35688 RepID=A0A5J4YMU5_PORPP|nr:hypothetical protein FVE85_8486 [Porphyridium purpureum]|eukprot:POR9883..scf244_11
MGQEGVALRVGGVPEHFNLPWKDAAEVSDKFVFVDVPEGSGRMVSGLLSGEFDAIVVLTECVVAEIEKRAPIKLIGTYVASPLLWGVHVNPAAHISATDDLRGKVFGVSRYGSGSHVMASVMAEMRGWNKDRAVGSQSTESMHFKVCHNFAGLRDALAKNDIDVFLWEKFMTKPFHDAKDCALITIDTVPTPWPCFVVAMRADASPESVRTAEESLSLALLHAKEFCDDQTRSASAERIAQTFKLSPEDAAAWLQQVAYAEAENPSVSHDVLEQSRKALLSAGVLEHETAANSLSLANYFFES